MLTSTKRELILEQLNKIEDSSFIVHYYEHEELKQMKVAYYQNVYWNKEYLYIDDDKFEFTNIKEIEEL